MPTAVAYETHQMLAFNSKCKQERIHIGLQLEESATRFRATKVSTLVSLDLASFNSLVSRLRLLLLQSTLVDSYWLLGYVTNNMMLFCRVFTH